MTTDPIVNLTTYLVESFREDVIGDTPIIAVTAPAPGLIELTVEHDPLDDGDSAVEYVVDIRITEHRAAEPERGAGLYLAGRQLPRAKLDELEGGWDSQVGQHPFTGPTGIGYRREQIDDTCVVDILIARGDDGETVGILYRYPNNCVAGDLVLEHAGNITVLVAPDARRQGIGTDLLREAARRWSIDLDQQTYTPEGRALFAHAVQVLGVVK